MHGLSATEARTHLLGALGSFAPFGSIAPRPILLAVSGGPDSLALLLLAAENRDHLQAAGFPLHVATVDHGLRAASASEAAFVARLAADRKLRHRTLRWDGAKPSGNIAAEARNARYRLLADHARAIDAVAVVTAHHQDDQIETHHLAAARHAGDRGLAGMRAARALAPGIQLLRPFLDVPGAALKAAVAERDILPVIDPANGDRRYARARLRAELDLTPDQRRETIDTIARHAARRDAEDAALGQVVGAWRRTGDLTVDACGTVRFAREAFRKMDRGLADILLSRVLCAVGGAEHPPSRLAVCRLAKQLRAQDPAAGATLGGVAVRVGETLAFHREYGRSGIGEQWVERGSSVVFDRRMRVSVPASVDGCDRWTLAPFGRTGRGNAVEKTLPMALDGDGRVVAAHPDLVRKLAETALPLAVFEEVSFRLFADLPMATET